MPIKTYPTTKPAIKFWAEDDRPREKLLTKGRASLSDAELLAVLIATGTKDDSAVDIAKKMLALSQNSLNNLAKLSVTDLQKVKGIGQAKAVTIISALELGRRRKEEAATDIVKITTSRQLFDLFEPLVGDLPHEEFWVLLLNRSNKIIDYKKISEGGVSSTVVDVKIILKFAIENLASSIVICHNHPSGSTTPSDSDIRLTRRITQACRELDLSLMDHIIIGAGAYYSFANDDTLKY